jgi:hypothetical protein
MLSGGINSEKEDKMSIKIEVSTGNASMPQSLGSIKETTQSCTRIHFDVTSVQQWYSIIRAARALYGADWSSQSRVKRRLEMIYFSKESVPVWFDVPDPAFATWISVKHAIVCSKITNK